eukprot:TRINITY_DN22090_c0_g1_i1.p1 TRINITY_DN22090_c0_g1~~TRINITY_DN22090_c0_g1_i1.p1  ORF type:complete len:335 (-),score=-12.99 TRINITY_DN22090_c0_g1_i1:176-1180(-)
MDNDRSHTSPVNAFRLYFLSPFVIYATANQSWDSVAHLCYSLLALVSSTPLGIGTCFTRKSNLSGSVILTIIVLACSFHLAHSPLMFSFLVFPSVHAALESSGFNNKKNGCRSVIVLRYLGCLAGVAGVYAALSPLQQQHQLSEEIPVQAQPNIGNWWYLTTQGFSRYSSFFNFVFSTHLFLYTIPLFTYLSGRPGDYFLIHLVMLLFYQRYPSIRDLGLITTVMVIRWKAIAFYEFPETTIVVWMISSCGLCVTGSLWLDTNTGNANYVYFQGVVALITFLLILSEWILGLLRFAESDIDESGNEIKETTTKQQPTKERRKSIKEELIRRSFC